MGVPCSSGNECRGERRERERDEGRGGGGGGGGVECYISLSVFLVYWLTSCHELNVVCGHKLACTTVVFSLSTYQVRFLLQLRSSHLVGVRVYSHARLDSQQITPTALTTFSDGTATTYGYWLSSAGI